MVRIVQCLCPQRHCILAFAYEPGISTTDEGMVVTEANASNLLEMQTAKLFATDQMNPYCDICKAATFAYEDRATMFDTLREAMPELQKMAAAQMRARAYFKASRN